MPIVVVAANPLPICGDLLTNDGSGLIRLPKGTDGQILSTGGASCLQWIDETGGGGGGTVTSVDGSGGTTGLSLTGGPISTSGTLTIGGVLDVPAGGTNFTSFATGDLLYGSGSTLIKLPVSTNGKVLTLTSGLPAWQMPASPGTGTVTSVSLSAGTTGLSYSGTNPITTSGTATLGGLLNVPSGGTNLSSYSVGDIIYASASTTLSKLAVSTNGKVLTLTSGLPAWQTPTTGSVTSVDGSGGTTGLSLNGNSMAYSVAILATSNLGNYWRLDETSGTTAVDYKNSLNGTYNNGYTLNQAAFGAGQTKSTLFNGSTGYVQVTSNSALHPTTAITLEAWIKPSSLPASSMNIAGCGFSGGGTPFIDYELAVDSTSKAVFQLGTGGSVVTFVTAPTGLSIGTWYHLVGTYDGTTACLYINGSLVTSTALTGSINNSGQTFTIGRYQRGGFTGEYFAGNISDVALYNTALSASSILAHYNAASSGTGPITSSGTLTLAGTLIAANGGTGLTSYTIGDIIYASATGTLSKLADVAVGNVLISGGSGTAPSYGKVGLATHVNGTLPVVSGGTGFNTFLPGDILFADTTSTFNKLADVAVGNVLLSGGTSTAPSYGKVGLATHVSGTLPIANGGSGLTSAFTAGSIIFSNGTTLAQDNVGLFYNDSTNFIGIGTNSPSYHVEVVSPDSVIGGIHLTATSYSNVPNPGSVSGGLILLNALGLGCTFDGATISSTYQPTTGLGIAINRINPAIGIKNSTGRAIAIENGGMIINNSTSNYPFEVYQASANYTAVFSNTATSGTKNGVLIIAGSNSSDFSLIVDNAANTANYFIVRGDGNVGVGVNPAYKFHVQTPSATGYIANFSGVQAANTIGAWINFQGGSAGATQRGLLGFAHTGSGGDTIFIGELADSMCLRGDFGLHLGCGVAGNYAVTVDTSNRVGIGTSTPTELLSVVSTNTTADSLVGCSMPNGCSLAIKSKTELVTISATSFTDTAFTLPAGCIVFCVASRVTVAIPGVSFYNVKTQDGNIDFCDTLPSGLVNTTNPGTYSCPISVRTSQPIRITPTSNPTTNAGRVRVTVFYMEITPPTS